MSIHIETQKVINYKDSLGKRVALKYFQWNKLDKTQEVIIANKLISLAELIDNETTELFPVEAQTAICDLIRNRGECINENLLHAEGDELVDNKESWENESKDLEAGLLFLTII